MASEVERRRIVYAKRWFFFSGVDTVERQRLEVGQERDQKTPFSGVSCEVEDFEGPQRVTERTEDTLDCSVVQSL